MDTTLAARQSADETLRLGTEPTGWADRTSEVKGWHDDYLKVTALVQRRKADIADIKTQLKLSIGEFEAIDGICSFKRTAKPVFDSAAFYRHFPNEAEHCAVLIRPRLRKRVYSSRSYLPILG